MKSILFICALIALVYADLDAWNEYKIYLDKKYDNNTETERHHFENFKINHQNIIEHNSQPNITYTMDHNEFSIFSNEDFRKMYLREMNGTVIADQYLQAGFDVGATPAQYPAGPASISFQQYCMPVRNQNPCGACWAFATSAQIETVLKRRNFSYNTFLSPQYLLDCAPNSGCVVGGSPNVAFNFIYRNGLLVQEANYPYVAVKQACRPNIPRINFRINSFTHYDLNRNEQQLMNILAYVGPVVIAMYAPPSFQFYKKGIYNDPTCPNTCASFNHGMLLVGYGVDSVTYGFPVGYWLIKNSWGTTFGENGYVRMIRGYNGYVNNCNVACSIDFSN